MRLGLVLACALAACSPQAPSEAPADVQSEAPAPHVVTTRIRLTQNGKRVDVTIGEPFSVELPNEQSMGLNWTPVQTPAFVSPAPEGSAVTPPDEAPAEAMPGGSSAQIFFFVATAAGEAELQLAQRDFGGGEVPAAETFRVTINAR